MKKNFIESEYRAEKGNPLYVRLPDKDVIIEVIKDILML